MKITLHKYYIQIQSEKLCDLIGKINGFDKTVKIKGGAFWPFLYLRYDDHPNNLKWINHERIHFAQQFELLFIFHFLLILLEVIYFKYIRRMNHMDSYLNLTFEQEAYLNQNNENYLKYRKLFSFLKYIRNKKRIKFIDKNGNFSIENL